MRTSIPCLGWIGAVPRAPIPWTDSDHEFLWLVISAPQSLCTAVSHPVTKSIRGDKVISSTRAKHSLQLQDCFPGEGRGNLRRWKSLFLINNEAFPKQLNRKHSSRASSEHSQGVVLPFDQPKELPPNCSHPPLVLGAQSTPLSLL